MKYSKRYIAFTGVLAVALLIKFNNFGDCEPFPWGAA